MSSKPRIRFTEIKSNRRGSEISEIPEAPQETEEVPGHQGR